MPSTVSGMFQAVTPRVLNPDEQGAPMDVEITVRERKPRSVQLGFGFSTVEQFRGEVQWTQRNLWGGAESLNLSAKGSSIQQAAEARFFLPYFLTRRTSFAQTAFARNQPKIDEDQLSVGGGTLFGIENTTPGYSLFSVGTESRVRREFSRRLSGAGGVELSRNVFSDVDPDLIGTGVAENNTLFIQFAELKWDTRDNLLNPTRGVVLSGELDHSNTALISTESFFKLLLEGRHYLCLVGEGDSGVPSHRGRHPTLCRQRQRSHPMYAFSPVDPAAFAAMPRIGLALWTARGGQSAATACSWGVLNCASRSAAISAAWCSLMPGTSTAAHRPMI